MYFVDLVVVSLVSYMDMIVGGVFDSVVRS